MSARPRSDNSEDFDNASAMYTGAARTTERMRKVHEQRLEGRREVQKGSPGTARKCVLITAGEDGRLLPMSLPSCRSIPAGSTGGVRWRAGDLHRIRRVGAANLVEAALAAGATRFLQE